MSGAADKCHLFVLVHGLWGGPNHMLTIERCLKELLAQNDKKVVVLRPSTFRFWKTYDGIKLCAERVLAEMFYEIETLKQRDNCVVDEISIIGYSLGGLIARYLNGALYEMGFFESVRPVFFTTFATPHVGIEFINNGVFDSIANRLGKFLFGISGAELFIQDSEKLLVEMAQPESTYFKALALFEKRILLSNVKNDRTVAFFTSYIIDHSPFDKFESVKIKYLKDLPQARIGNVCVRPKFVDLTRSVLLSPNEKFVNVQEATSVARSNKFYRYGIVFVFACFLFPVWLPSVLSATFIVSVYTRLKVKIIASPENQQHWERVKDSVYGTKPVDDEDYKIGTKQRDQRRKLQKQESFKGDTSVMAENAMEGVLYAEERFTGKSPQVMADEQGDNDLDSPQDGKALNSVREADDEQYDEEEDIGAAGHGVDSQSTLLDEGSVKMLNIDIKANEKAVATHMEALKIKDISKFPLFTEQNKLPLGTDKMFIVNQLNSLDWIKIPVYIEAWNSHDGIVARRGPKTNPKGTATIAMWVSILNQLLSERKVPQGSQ